MRIPENRTVVIVAFKRDIENADAVARMAALQPVPIPRVVHYQVTLDRTRMSPSGEFIRFGMWGDSRGQGDEITGWIGIRELVLLEELAVEDDRGVLRPCVASGIEQAA